MNNFITFVENEQKTEFFFNKNHYLILLSSLVVIVFFSMYISRQKLKTQKIFILICSILLFLFEALKIYWTYRFLIFQGREVTFVTVTEFNFFTLSLWISLPLIFLALLTKKEYEGRYPFALSFVFNISTIIAICSLIYPSGLKGEFALYHFYNLTYVVSRVLIIAMGFTFVLGHWISTSEFGDLYRCILSLLCFILISGMVGGLLSHGTNLLDFNFSPLLENLGLHLRFPFHYLVEGLFFFMLQILFYFPFRIIKYFKYKKTEYSSV